MELSFGQKVDPANNLIMPWLTHPALEEIAVMEWGDKVVLEYGAGLGDSWIEKKCKKLHVIERNQEWYNTCQIYNDGNIEYHFRPCNDSSGKDEFYLAFPEAVEPDIIISDDAYRTEAVEKAINYFKQKENGGILICDNYWQSYVWRSPKAVELLEPFQKKIFEQSDHQDYNKEEEPDGIWKTAIIFIK